MPTRMRGRSIVVVKSVEGLDSGWDGDDIYTPIGEPQCCSHIKGVANKTQINVKCMREITRVCSHQLWTISKGDTLGPYRVEEDDHTKWYWNPYGCRAIIRLYINPLHWGQFPIGSSGEKDSWEPCDLVTWMPSHIPIYNRLALTAHPAV